MRKITIFLVLLLIVSKTGFAGEMEDDPLLAMLVIDQLEVRTSDESNPVIWDAEGWVGKDLNKLWIKSDGTYVDSQIEETELQLLYSRAIMPFWDLQLGWRRNIRPSPDRDWIAFGAKGLAPYYFDVDAAFFVGDSGRTSLRFKAEYDFMLTQRLILVPDLELNLYGQDDYETGIGSGLSSIEAGLRLRYEIRREFAPYIGLNWTGLYGRTADLARDEGEDTNELQFVVGIRSWF